METDPNPNPNLAYHVKLDNGMQAIRYATEYVDRYSTACCSCVVDTLYRIVEYFSAKFVTHLILDTRKKH